MVETDNNIKSPFLSVHILTMMIRFGNHKKNDDDDRYPVMAKHSIRSTLLLSSLGLNFFFLPHHFVSHEKELEIHCVSVYLSLAVLFEFFAVIITQQIQYLI